MNRISSSRSDGDSESIPTSSALVLAAGLVVPFRADAQIRGRDLDRAVRVGTLVYGVAREIKRETAGSRRSPDTAGRTARPGGAWWVSRWANSAANRSKEMPIRLSSDPG